MSVDDSENCAVGRGAVARLGEPARSGLREGGQAMAVDRPPLPPLPLLETRGQVLAAVASNGYWLACAGPCWQDDDEVVRRAVASKGMALAYASTRLRACRPVVLTAVAQDAFALCVADPAMRDDRDVILAAARKHFAVYVLASRKVREDEAFMVNLFRNEVRNQILCGFMPEDVPALLRDALDDRERHRQDFFLQAGVPCGQAGMDFRRSIA